MRDVDFFYGGEQVLKKVSARFPENAVSAVTGPSGQENPPCLAYSTAFGTRSRSPLPGRRPSASAGDWVSPLKNDLPLPFLRRKVAMIFQEPDPLPMSIARNMAFP